jgi:hypothetical protein
VSILNNVVLLIKGHGSGSRYLKMNNAKKSRKSRKNTFPAKICNDVGFNNVSLVWFPYESTVAGSNTKNTFDI